MLILDLPWVFNASYNNMSLILWVTFNSGENRGTPWKPEYVVKSGVYGNNRSTRWKPEYMVKIGIGAGFPQYYWCEQS